jgi:hypothetical protein
MRALIIVMILLISNQVWSEEGSGMHFYPLMDYSEETGFSGGGVFIRFWRSEGIEKNKPPSFLKLEAETGIKRSWKFEIENEWQFDEGNYAINFPLSIKHSHCEIYGTGNVMDLDKYQEIVIRTLHCSFEMLRRWDNYELGFVFMGNYDRYYEEISENYLLQDDKILPFGGRSVGPGLTFSYNTLNHQYYPQKGIRIQFDLRNLSEALWSDYTFDRYSVSAAGFLPLWKMTTWASEIKFIANNGEVPYQELSSLGEELRIFQSGQFVDNYLVSAVSELRSFPWDHRYWRRFGFVIFAEAGQVRADIEDFNLSGYRYGLGIGVRYLLNIEELFTLRLDAGNFREQVSVNFGTREAF